ncbi:MAG TPA: M23 family metallopeptidase [Candidatus Binatia bacterium]|nr:M23 family metallopeptidase [Candidatus Binatia bacterium]
MGELAFSSVLSLLLLSAPLSFAANGAEILWPRPLEALQGELVEVAVGGDDLLGVGGLLGQERIYFQSSQPGVYTALVGVDVEAKPATIHLVLTATTVGGAQHQKRIPLKIKARSFHKESFSVAPSFDEMSPETLAEIRREQAAFARAFANTAAERFWSLPFLRPVPQEASASSFGSRRIINGVPRAPHTGTDLSAPAGTEVVAVNHGKVALVGNYFFAGGSVIIDHGGGLYSMYFHLSEFKVEEGAMVRRGDVVALSGGTGRVTGPHLHWGVRLNNSRVDPLALLRKFSWQTDASETDKTSTNAEK